MKNLMNHFVLWTALAFLGSPSLSFANHRFSEKEYVQYEYIKTRLDKYKGDLNAIREEANKADALSFFENEQAPVYSEISKRSIPVREYLGQLQGQPKTIFYHDYYFDVIEGKGLNTKLRCKVYIKRKVFWQEMLVTEDILLATVNFRTNLKNQHFKVLSITKVAQLPAQLASYQTEIRGRLEALIELKTNRKYGGLSSESLLSSASGFFSEYKDEYQRFLKGNTGTKKIFRVRLLKKFEKNNLGVDDDTDPQRWNSTIRIDQYIDQLWARNPNSSFLYPPRLTLSKQSNRLFSNKFDAEVVVRQRKLINGHHLTRKYIIGLSKVNPKKGLKPKRLYFAGIENEYLQPALTPKEISIAEDSVCHVLSSFHQACLDMRFPTSALVSQFLASNQVKVKAGKQLIACNDYLETLREQLDTCITLKLMPHQASRNHVYFIVAKTVFGQDSLNVAVQFKKNQAGELSHFKIDGIVVTGNGGAPAESSKGTTDLLVEGLQQQKLTDEWMRARVNVNYDIRHLGLPVPNILQQGSGTALVKIQTNKVISISVKKMGFELFRIQINQWGVKATNRLMKEYYEMSFADLSKSYGVGLSFDDLQAAILGLPLFLEGNELQAATDNAYHLTGQYQDIHTEYWVASSELMLNRMKFYTPDKKISMEVDYSDYKALDAGLSLPKKRVITFYDEAMGSITLKLISSTINGQPWSLNTSIEIPSHYQKID
ncbi:MAG: DUF4292 domain-containing protein [Chitinophagales bacterium]|nr:DUF4292 domain-containing protein [Chitinophagales bacterium]